jgi:hypothetical protein
MAKKRIPDKLQIWIEARKKYRLSHAQVQMARELGLNPKKFGGLANHRQEPWKMPLPQFIEHIYFKRFGKVAPDNVLSIEDRLKKDQGKKEERRARKHANARAINQKPASEKPGELKDQDTNHKIMEK